MTEEKFTEAVALKKELIAAEKDLYDFEFTKNNLKDKFESPVALESNIDVKIKGRDGLFYTREVPLSASMVAHLYNQELNHKRAKVHHLKTKFSRL